MSINEQIKLKYRDEFRGLHGESFQGWFEKLATVLHGEGCFLAIRVTRGDGGLDGLVLKEGRVYQLYAPPSLATDSSTASKIEADFNKAKETLSSSFKTWTFVHNSPDGKVGHLTAAKLAQLKEQTPAVSVEAIGIDGLWERLNKLPNEKLASLFGLSSTPNQAVSQIRALLNQASNLGNQDKRGKAFEVMEQALAIAEAEKIANLQAEVLIGLSLISSKRDGLGDRSHFFQRVLSMQNSITEVPVLVMFHRAHGAYLEQQRDLLGAETAYMAAIALASSPDNTEKCEALLCVARSELVHLLCNANRTSEADMHVQLAEAYAKRNSEMLDGDIFQAALNAGLDWSVKMGDEDAAIERIQMLKASANNSYLASRIAGQLINVANNSSLVRCHRVALAASDSALQLGDKLSIDTKDKFLPMALYTVAMVNFHAGRLENALQRANSLVNFAVTPETAQIRFAAAQLVSVISRQIGDLATAVGTAELALELAQEVDSSFMAKLNLAEALADSGQTERALKLAQEAHSLINGRANIPMHIQIKALGHIAEYSAQLGDSDSLQRAMSELNECQTDTEEARENKEKIKKRVKANIEIRKRIIDISLMGQEPSIIKKALGRVREFPHLIGNSKKEVPSSKYPIMTLHQANALTIAPVMRWWEDFTGDYDAVALDYDYWGRGCFAQILQNLQSFPHSLNVTIEVRTLEDIRRSIRLWSLYADFIILLWKGPTKSGRVLHLVDGEYFGPWGAGYMVGGDKLKSKTGRIRFPAVGYASRLPADVAKFLVAEAKDFLASGRLILVPASGVGCVSPGHGVMEQLLTEATNCIPAIQRSDQADLPIGLLPYVQDVPMDVLFDFVNESADDLQYMRKLLLSRTAHIKTNGLQQSPKALELEIGDALKRIQSQNTALVRKRNLSAAEQVAQVSISPFRVGGYGLFGVEDEVFSPLLTLESMGYGWKVGAPSQSRPAYRYEPADGEAIGAWLAPPECGVRLLMIKK